MMMSGLSSALVGNGLSYQEENWNRYLLEAKANMLVSVPGRVIISGEKASGYRSRVKYPGPPSAATAPSGQSAETVKSLICGVMVALRSLG